MLAHVQERSERRSVRTTRAYTARSAKNVWRHEALALALAGQGDTLLISGTRSAEKPHRVAGVGDRPMTFIVRIIVDEGGAISGVVEQVRTGGKEPIHATEDISRVIAVMVAGERGGRTDVK